MIRITCFHTSIWLCIILSKVNKIKIVCKQNKNKQTNKQTNKQKQQQKAKQKSNKQNRKQNKTKKKPLKKQLYKNVNMNVNEHDFLISRYKITRDELKCR